MLERLRAGQTIALVSDAGTPLVSDPGYRLVRAAIAAGFTGHRGSGTQCRGDRADPVRFAAIAVHVPGISPAKQAARRAAFGSLRAAERAGLSATLIWHEAPHRLLETLADLQEVFGDRAAAVARELTKRFETVERGKVSELATLFTREPPRGEITVLIGPPETDDPEDLDGRLAGSAGDADGQGCGGAGERGDRVARKDCLRAGAGNS